eukprot:scaffold235899_cov49-Prasinocladus_malaysianus.AAC.3
MSQHIREAENFGNLRRSGIALIDVCPVDGIEHTHSRGAARSAARGKHEEPVVRTQVTVKWRSDFYQGTAVVPPADLGRGQCRGGRDEPPCTRRVCLRRLQQKNKMHNTSSGRDTTAAQVI